MKPEKLSIDFTLNILFNDSFQATILASMFLVLKRALDNLCSKLLEFNFSLFLFPKNLLLDDGKTSTDSFRLFSTNCLFLFVFKAVFTGPCNFYLSILNNQPFVFFIVFLNFFNRFILFFEKVVTL